MSSWQDRLRPEIKFVSPSELEFTPLWKGNDISAEKRLGRHAYPNVDQEVVQDLGMNSREVPLTVYFDGADHDKNARDFEKALYEPGVWQVTHPVYGLLLLQLVSYKLAAEPVESANVTVVETEWVEPADEDGVAAIPDPAAAVEVAVEDVNKTSISDIRAAIQKTVSQGKAIAGAVKQGINAVRGVIRFVDAEINAIQSQINRLTNEVYLDIASIAGGVIAIIEAPGLMMGSITSKITMFRTLGNRIIDDLLAATGGVGRSGGGPGGSGGGTNVISKTGVINHINTALVGQLFLNAITAAMAATIISSPAQARQEALAMLNEYRRFTSEAQAALDRAESITAGNHMENQFVARANSGEAIATLNAAVARYLMEAIFNLKIERRMALDRPRAPLEIAITEYKASGENADYYYDLFCRTNRLSGRDLLLLPTGREVVIYG